MKSKIFSIAVLSDSVERTREIAKIWNIHSVLDMSRYKPATINKNEKNNCTWIECSVLIRHNAPFTE